MNRNVLSAFSIISTGGLLFGYIIGITSNVITEGQLLCPKDEQLDEASFMQTVNRALIDPQLAKNPKEAVALIKHIIQQRGSITYGRGISSRSSLLQLEETGGFANRLFTAQTCYNLDPVTIGVLTSINLIGAMVASLFCFRYADSLGRRMEVQIAAILYFLGAVIAAASPNLLGVFMGLTIYGLGVGFAMHVAPVYIAEISPAATRGKMISAKEAVIVGGMVLGYLIGWMFSYTVQGWRYMIAMSAVFALIMGFGMRMIAESPRWLELQGRQEDALASLQFYRDGEPLEDVKEELRGIHEEVVSNAAGISSWLDCFQYPKPLMIGCGLVLLQQVTGQPSVLYFATNIFKEIGFGSSAAQSSLLIGVVKLIATLISAETVDSCGRRTLLFIGIGMMTIALIILTVSTSQLPTDMTNSEVSRFQATVIIAALMFYVSGYQVGFGPISWLMMSEIFPLHVKGAAISVAAMMNFAANMVVTSTQPVLTEAIGLTATFAIYSLLSVVSIVFVFFVVPETRGKTLEEITAEFRPLLKS